MSSPTPAAPWRPRVGALLRWGTRFLLPTRPRERLEADWLRLLLEACARPGPTPPRSFNLHVRQPRQEIAVRITGSADGVRVDSGAGAADATITADARTVLGLITGALSASTAVREGRVKIDGDPDALEAFRAMFDVDPDIR